MSADEILSGLLRASPLYAAGALFALRARRLARDRRPLPAWRTVAFTAGVAVAVVADLPPIGTTSERLLSVHMVQHLLIGDLAALLIAVSVTGPLLRPVLVLPVLRHLRWCVHPFVAVPLWVVVYYGWHIPFLYQAALRSDVVHGLEHATMFGAGLAMWMGLLGPLPKPRWFTDVGAMVYIIVMRFAGAAIANFFIWSGTPFYPEYADIAASRGGDATADQSIAGAIWMLEGTVATLGVFAWIFARWMSRGIAAQDLVDFAQGLGVELEHERARRAVAAGRAEHLRARVVDEARAGANHLPRLSQG